MPFSLTQSESPLEQARRDRAAGVRHVESGLNPHEEVELQRVFDDEKYDWVDHESFHEPGAEKAIFEEPDEVPRPDVSWYGPVLDNQNLADTPATKGKKTVLLTAAQERVIFYQYNYARFRVCELRDQMRESGINDNDARELLRWHRRAENLREQIANTNLALVLAMSKRVRMSNVDFPELISEGNMALLRAIDKFDASYGFKFSTYACRAILKSFSRAGVKTTRYRHMFPTGFDPQYERSNYQQTVRAEHEQDCADEVREIVADNRAHLSEVEREVIEHRFGMSEAAQQQPDRPLTLAQVGKLIGVTKERVRQIQNQALEKLRNELESDFLR
ncbi:MAG: sigma-70 family RNA polymerase sigma factor [Phycisphaeraceae bacterium]|nr:sigma-70 family RNA polymerase sigma factor [Phycisphaeraceae bacterium]